MSDRNDRRNEFINEAEKLFKENGIVNTTINEIVKNMHVAKGLFYYYFSSKDDVIDAISEKYNKNFRETIQKNLSGEKSYEERLHEFIGNTVQSFRTLWENLQGAGKDIDLSILSSRSMNEAKKTASEALKKLLDEGNKLGKLAIKNTAYFADIITGGMADLAGKKEASLKEIQKIIEDLIKESGKEDK